ncbi:MAG: MSMEG_1061 family FMN-dependent PPOX-type flavoprotein [Halopseudomonas sp.]|uniref:MSMEG_1061 family FMN-dependent PPOX-type flavoprotein n=1 Tax=Halopseudomonas sp. TaxID=2901191 RepID=UPI003001E735
MKITSMEQLREIMGEAHPATQDKIYDHLNPAMQEFIEQSPLLFMATVDAAGFPSLSPKGDAPGFVRVADAHQLLIPERKGNRMALSFDNILAGSRLGLLFMVPGVSEVLRVQGEAEIIHDAELNGQMASDSQQALVVTRLRVQSAFFHCGKALLRSRLWKRDLAHAELRISFGEQIAQNPSKRANTLAEQEIAAFDAGLRERYQQDL